MLPWNITCPKSRADEEHFFRKFFQILSSLSRLHSEKWWKKYDFINFSFEGRELNKKIIQIVDTLFCSHPKKLGGKNYSFVHFFLLSREWKKTQKLIKSLSILIWSHSRKLGEKIQFFFRERKTRNKFQKLLFKFCSFFFHAHSQKLGEITYCLF